MRMKWVRDRRNGVGRQEVGGRLNINFLKAERLTSITKNLKFLFIH